jgi:UDP-glucose 4-epimerase
MTKNKAIVTGAAGFIGGHLLEELLSRGHEAVGVDNMSNGHPELLPTNVSSKIITADFVDEMILSAIELVDVVYHMAAVPRVSYSVEHPFATYLENYHKTVMLLEAIRCSKRKPRFVLASSSSVYGGEVPLPTKEDGAGLFTQASPYAMQKAQCEMALRMYAKLYNIDCVSLRFFNVFGPRQLGDSPYATAIAAWFSAHAAGKPARSDGDGTQTRDMCYVSNVVDACILAGERQNKFSAQSYNIGCSDRTSNNEILSWFKRRYSSFETVSAPTRAGDVMHTQADITSAKEDLDYVPRVNIWHGLDLTADWAEKNLEWRSK